MEAIHASKGKGEVFVYLYPGAVLGDTPTSQPTEGRDPRVKPLDSFMASVCLNILYRLLLIQIVY